MNQHRVPLAEPQLVLEASKLGSGISSMGMSLAGAMA
jgi:hypothetical protein